MKHFPSVHSIHLSVHLLRRLEVGEKSVTFENV